jgi:GntR family transcriptional regulator
VATWAAISQHLAQPVPSSNLGSIQPSLQRGQSCPNPFQVWYSVVELVDVTVTRELRRSTRSAEPRFRQVATALTHAVADGEITDRLPTERALCEQFDVSRVTLRRALASMAESGLITPSWGRGWYVTKEPLSEPPNALLSFTELAEQRNLTPSARVLGHARRSASLDEASILHIAPGSDLVQLDRLRLLDNVPIVLQRSLLALTRLHGFPSDLEALDLEHNSLYSILEETCLVFPTRATFTVEARGANNDEAHLLNIPEGSPTLCTAQVTFDQHGEPFEQHWSVYPHDRYRFQATLVAPPRSRLRPPGLTSQSQTTPRHGLAE